MATIKELVQKVEGLEVSHKEMLHIIDKALDTIYKLAELNTMQGAKPVKVEGLSLEGLDPFMDDTPLPSMQPKLRSVRSNTSDLGNSETMVQSGTEGFLQTSEEASDALEQILGGDDDVLLGDEEL